MILVMGADSVSETLSCLNNLMWLSERISLHYSFIFEGEISPVQHDGLYWDSLKV